jgi:hypothetical protein
MIESRVISADSHVQELPDLYERLPKGRASGRLAG